ncbi:hypothetical protein AZF37_03800 [endosymbiont 'TC1' of Trimyema compressum]|uniref:DUF4352 domain-containing protein n=1 Tax=endosymbiont 'TC1' of Trimyema compressum TaxID=243899 RepID=UPI0007F0DB96|nr:DUF4352 domain-containing protein [endosymbiont 'TC1' of Trimyema compressum]AMP20408.1 hypothetical protein AZF37_03800 [endosymbiont 'TC1' of Trimyema compressum]
MKRKTLVILSILILLLVVAICITFFKENSSPEDSLLTYKVENSVIENNTAHIKFTVTVERGKNIDPISQVRLVEENNLASYPINGYPKILLSKGESKEFQFTFHFPSSEKATLEITSSGGNTENLVLSFPEVATREQGVKIEDSSLAIGEDLTIGSSEKYLVNNYRFSQVGDTLPPEGMVYLIVNMTLENVSDYKGTVVYLNKDNFSLKNYAGQFYEKGSDKAVGTKKADKDALQKGEKTAFDVAFVVPKTEKKFQLFLNGKKIFIIEKTEKQ